MKYKKLSKEIQNLENNFNKSLDDFKNDEIFKKSSNIYLKKDKKILYAKWKKIASIFKKLKFIIKLYSYNLNSKNRYNNFIIKYYCICLYYNMTLSIQETFKEHEDFIRQFLDENYKENYSTIARYIYRANFLYYLNYPKSFLLLIKNNIDKELFWMTKKDINYNIKLDFEYKNFYYYFKSKIDKILYIFVKYFGLLLSKIKIKNKLIIKPDIINKFYEKALPGDIILNRQNFIATNLFIPGFWKHMAMYLGTGEYLNSNFKNNIFKKLDKNTHYIIESTGKGVNIETVENFILNTTYLGVFRTTFSDEKIKKAITKSLKMLNKDYDYLFNYYSDNTFVCSELITKSYLKDKPDDEGLSINLIKISSGLTYPPNELVKKAYKEKNMVNKEIIPILFIDYIKKTNKSFIGSNNELLQSYKRSKISFFLK